MRWEEKWSISLTAWEAESPGSGSYIGLAFGEGLMADGILTGAFTRGNMWQDEVERIPASSCIEIHS